MLRKILLICLIGMLPGCVLFAKKETPVNVTVVAREPLNLPIPEKPTFEKSKSVEWKVEEDKVYTDRNGFAGFMEDLIDLSKYNEKLLETLKKYQDYTDKDAPKEPQK